MPPNVCMPHTFIHPPYVCTPPGVYTSPICLHTPLCLCVLETLHVVGGCNGLSFVLGHHPLHHPCLGVPPLYYSHTLSHWFPMHQYVSGISVCHVGISLLSGRFWGCFPHQLGGWGHQHFRCPYAHSCTFFVVHYVSHFD